MGSYAMTAFADRVSCSGTPHILFCASASHLRHVAVAAVSLLDHLPGETAHIHVMTCEIDRDAQLRLQRSLSRYQNAKLSIQVIPAADLSSLFVSRHVSRECYLRILAPTFLPKTIKRVLYLDCDVVVVDDVGPLWSTDLEGCVLAAAPDHPWDPDGRERERTLLLGVSKHAPYINSGVLLIDLERWRAARYTSRLLDFARKAGAALTFHDQDAINVVLADDIKLLDSRWNLQARMYRLPRHVFPDQFETTRDGRRRPAIVHFTTADKPWIFGSQLPMRQYYYKYLDRTDWRQVALEGWPLRCRFLYRCDRLLLALGLDWVRITWPLRRLAAWTLNSRAENVTDNARPMAGGSLTAGERSGP